ncbi:ribonuclease E activity regulator RraA [Deinococcus maricopensis]|uniref:4-hydroxy-4-methyl-2-oxoglutarate aldolase n=1 Tax=Deinococcus maricopensis (strain DSM 21211 / LMG 22137 / NRRL B-23946 / LB-34) TaxID=709986 RepID=E8U556_DEIML|nr:ribonuclease E activity regulator RraA [Deinococcus maricopensis]ADV66195.1 Regulator of ribonuclease activity A [Deinococcus maricopensis DSM 21211]
MTAATYATTDLSDAHTDVHIAEPVWRSFGGRAAFHGRARTVQVHEDNVLVRAELATPGEGRVLVVDGGGSLRCALLGDMLGELAVRNGWAGVVVYGCVRDTRALGTLDLGVLALAPHPRRSGKLGAGEAGVPVTFAGVTVQDGDHVYADEDGLLISSAPLGEQA